MKPPGESIQLHTVYAPENVKSPRSAGAFSVGVLGAYSNQNLLATARQVHSLLEKAHAERAPRAPRATRRQSTPKKPSPEVHTAIAEDYRAGMQMKELAAKYGLHRVTVRACLDRAGVEVRRKGLTREQIDEAQRLYEESQRSLAVIANELGTTARTIHSRLRERGVAMRDTHGRSRT